MISQQLYNIGRRFPNDFPIIIHNFPDEYPNHSSQFAYWKIMGIMMNYRDYPNSSHFIYRSSPTQAHGLQPWKKPSEAPSRSFARPQVTRRLSISELTLPVGSLSLPAPEGMDQRGNNAWFCNLSFWTVVKSIQNSSFC